MQAIYNIAEICARHGVEDVVLSPGSRCAPLTFAFVNHPAMQCKSVTDERSAAYIALGMALEKDKPVVLVCTSGTASLNYYPAIAEAYYQAIPLLVITADRPAEWIDQQDGQAIRQHHVYANHIKKSWTLPTDHMQQDSMWHIERIVSEALLLAQCPSKGPVHINAPFREPFYPKENEEISYSEPKCIFATETEKSISHPLAIQSVVDASAKTLIVVGQQKNNDALNKLLQTVHVPILCDTIANVTCDTAVLHHDLFLGCLTSDKAAQLQPDLLITFGLSVVSKNTKLFLRKHKPKRHIHIGALDQLSDTFQVLSDVVDVSPAHFFETIKLPDQKEYVAQWNTYDKITQKELSLLAVVKGFSEFKAIQYVLSCLPANIVLHVANSMPIRYVNFLHPPKMEIQANRGTSGIDGSLSTAIGASLADPTRLHMAILGDLSFFYDRNALWNNYLPPNLKIVVLNNHGGGIFRMIQGPKVRKECEEFFVTKQNLSAKITAIDHGLAYYSAYAERELKEKIQLFLAEKGTALFEVFTDGMDNTTMFTEFKALLHSKY